MTDIIIGSVIIILIIIGLGLWCYAHADVIVRLELPNPKEDSKGEDTSPTKTEYPDDELLGLGKKFAREIVDITEDSITYVDPLTNTNRTISEPILQFVREVKNRVNTFAVIPRGDDYCNNSIYLRVHTKRYSYR